MLLATLVTGLVLAGSYLPWQRATLHALVGLAAVLTALLPDTSLHNARRARRLFLALLPMAGALGVGLVPLPRAVLGLVAPGVAEARLHSAWWTLSLSPERTISELGLLFLVAGCALVVGLWAGRGRREMKAEDALVVMAVGLAVFAFGHALSGASSILGLLPLRAAEPPFFAPLVNPNHLGSVLLLALPLLAWRAAESSSHGWLERLLGMGPVLLVGALLLALRSPGCLLALALQAGLLLLWWPSPERSAAVGLGRGQRCVLAALLGCSVLIGTLAAWLHPTWARLSLVPRLVQWSDALPVLRDHWLAGVGGGAYVNAYPPYRTLPTFASFEHLHSDPLEWLVETGLVGVVAAVAVALLLPRLQRGHRRDLWVIGLAGIGLAALWNFPLQIPGVLLVVAACAAVRFAGFDHVEPVGARGVRVLLVVVAVVQVGFAGWELRFQAADRAAHHLVHSWQDAPTADRALRVLQRYAPWRSEVDLYRAIQAEREGSGVLDAVRVVEQRHPEDAAALRRSALVLLRTGHESDALRVLERSALRDPNDFRTWALVASTHQARQEGGEAVQAWAEALRHWPLDQSDGYAPLTEAYSLAPVGSWWLDELADAPAFWSARLAVILLEEGEHDTALLALDQAGRLKPETYLDSPLRGRVLARMGREAEAEQVLRGIVERDPDSPYAWRELGALLEEQGRSDEALRAYLSSLDLLPSHVDTALAAIRAAEQEGGPDKALLTAERIEFSLPHQPRIGLEVARLHQVAGRTASCTRELERRDLLEDRQVGTQAARLHAQCRGPIESP